MNKTDVDAAINSRMSVRAFTQQPVAKSDLEDMLQVASRAASILQYCNIACNSFFFISCAGARVTRVWMSVCSCVPNLAGVSASPSMSVDV